MDWSPLGCNPVIGEPDRIRTVGAGECQRVSDAAREGQTELKRIFAGLDDSIWNDASARKLEQKTPDVVNDLRKLRDGYGDVASALLTYVGELESAQSMARTANERMRSAQSSERHLVDRRGALEGRARALDGERHGVEAELARLTAEQRRLGTRRALLQQQLAIATDPVVADSLRRQLAPVAAALTTMAQQLASARGRLPGIDQQRAEVDQELRSVGHALGDAVDAQRRARRLAEAAVTTRDSAAKRAEADVRAAAKRTVGTTADKLKYEVRSSAHFNIALEAIDSFAEDLNSAIAVCDVLAKIPGVGAVFGPVTLILRGVAVATAVVSIAGHVVKAAAGGEAMDAAWFLARGMSALTALQGSRDLSKAASTSKVKVLTEKKRLIQGQTKVITNSTRDAQRAAIRQFDASEVVRRRVLAYSGQVRRAQELPFQHPTGSFDTVRSLGDLRTLGHASPRHLLALTEGSRLGLLVDGASAVDDVVQGVQGGLDLRDRFTNQGLDPGTVTTGDASSAATKATWELLGDHYRAVR